MAHMAGVPVIVDAAAQLPPAENLWRLTGQGADVALFSGGKALCGPASTGLILGRASFIERIAANAAPLQRLGRPMKAGKEDLVGILAAVEWYLGQDPAALSSRYEAVVDHFVQWARGRSDVVGVREPLGEAGQPTPRALIRVIGQDVGQRDRFLATLRRTPPRIDLLADEDRGFYVAPETLQPGEEAVISRRIGALLDGVG